MSVESSEREILLNGLRDTFTKCINVGSDPEHSEITKEKINYLAEWAYRCVTSLDVDFTVDHMNTLNNEGSVSVVGQEGLVLNIKRDDTQVVLVCDGNSDFKEEIIFDSNGVRACYTSPDGVSKVVIPLSDQNIIEGKSTPVFKSYSNSEIASSNENDSSDTIGAAFGEFSLQEISVPWLMKEPLYNINNEKIHVTEPDGISRTKGAH